MSYDRFPLRLDAGLLDDRSVKRLAALAANPGPVPLVIFEAPAGDVGPLAGQAFAQAVLGDEQACRADVRVCRPEGDRWTIAEIDASIIRPSQLRPRRRNLIVVAAADAMDVRAAEHLLKAVEEPPAPTLFVFVTTSTASLLATIVGRAGHVLSLSLAAPDERAAALAAAGADPEVAAEVVDLAGPLVGLARQVALAGKDRDAQLEALRSCFRTPLAGPAPAGRAVRFAASVDVLAKPAGAAAAKAVARDLMRYAISCWRAQVSAMLACVADVATFTWVTAAAAALDDAEADLRAYTSLPVVTLSLFSRVGSAPTAS